MKTGILFDLDGTLLDTLGDLAASVNAAMGHFGYPRRTLEEVRRFVGNGARRLLELSVPEGGDAEAALAFFRSHYALHCQDRTAPYSGIREALGKIAEEFPVAIVSNKPDAAVKELCSAWFPGIYALGEGPGCPRKPAPDMLLQTMARLGLTNCVYVGDSEVDIETARNAQVPCLSVLWGFRDREELEQAGGNHFCDSPSQLYESIKELTYGK